MVIQIVERLMKCVTIVIGKRKSMDKVPSMMMNLRKLPSMVFIALVDGLIHDFCLDKALLAKQFASN